MIIYDSSSSYDYYDSVMKSGVDRSIKYIRKTEIVKKDFKLDKLHRFSQNIYDRKIGRLDTDRTFLISICGNYYNGLALWSYNLDDKFNHYFYDKKSLFSVLENSKYSNADYNNLKPAYFNKVELFERGFSQDLFNLHIEYKTPILVNSNFDDEIGNYGEFNLVKDANLKQYEFQKVLDPYTIFQMIQQFISGVLSNPEKEIWPISDQIKAESHGFDKWSFRKQKHQRKV